MMESYTFRDFPFLNDPLSGEIFQTFEAKNDEWAIGFILHSKTDWWRGFFGVLTKGKNDNIVKIFNEKDFRK